MRIHCPPRLGAARWTVVGDHTQRRLITPASEPDACAATGVHAAECGLSAEYLAGIWRHTQPNDTL